MAKGEQREVEASQIAEAIAEMSQDLRNIY
jgi:hypothetical protein